MAYDQGLIKDLLQAANIADVVRYYLPDSFQKKGKGYAARCPFHDDHDPSLSINVEKQIYHCFVCGNGGNSIRFVQEYTHCSFPEAIRKTAEIVGFHDPRLDSAAPIIKADPKIQVLLDCMKDLQDYYRFSLTTDEGRIAREYLAKRNIDLAQQEKFGIGYAPIDGAKTVQYLRAKGYSPKNIEDVGISSAIEGKDRNAGRLTFPIANAKGNVVGFSARQLIKDPNTGKYMNSPETPIFKKSQILYNYHNVSSNAKKEGYCYVLEGFMDVMALDKAGIPCAIALMGTALTKEHVLMLRRLNCEIRLCLDGDQAGQEGMRRAYEPLTRGGLSFRMVNYESDLRDPDDILQDDGPEALKRRMQDLSDPLDFLLNYYGRSRKAERAEDKQALLNAFAPLISKEAGIIKENHIQMLAKAIGYDSTALRNYIERSKGEEKGLTQNSFVEENAHLRANSGMLKRLTKRLAKAEDTILAYALNDPEARKNLVNRPANPLYTDLYREIMFVLSSYCDEHQEEFDVSNFLNYVDDNLEDPEKAKAADAIISGLVSTESKAIPPYTPQAIEGCIKVIRDERIKYGEQNAAKKAIDSGDSKIAAEAIAALAKKKQEEWNSKKKSNS